MEKGPGGLSSVQTAVWQGDLFFSVNRLRNKGISGGVLVNYFYQKTAEAQGSVACLLAPEACGLGTGEG